MMILVYGLLGFVFLVFIHELGHFAVARLFGMQVNEFAIGMGPTLVQKKLGNTVYKICLIPLGGYCAIKGQSDFGTTDRNQDSDSFFGKSSFARFCVVAAGPLFSFLLGYILLTTVVAINGENRLEYTIIDPPRDSANFSSGDKILEINGNPIKYWDEVYISFLKNLGSPNSVLVERDKKPVLIMDYMFNPSEKSLPDSDFATYKKTGPTLITGVQKDSPAEQMGLLFGDIIVSANGTPINTERDLNHIVKYTEQPIQLIIHRYNNIQNLLQNDPYFFLNKIYPYNIIKVNITPTTIKDKKLLGLGLFVFEGKEVSDLWQHNDIPFLKALNLGWEKSWNMLFINAKAISQLVKGNETIIENLSGPIKIFHTVGKITELYGFITFLSFVGSISLALAFFNLLPFPALDGGHMVIAIIEGIIRRPINAKVLNTIQVVGIVCLLTVFVLVTIKDISGLFG